MEKVEKWASLVLTFLFSIFGTCGYVIYVYVITKDRQQRFANPFYALTLSWCIPEFYKSLQGLIISSPILISDIFEGDWIPKWYRTVTGFFFTVSWLASIGHMLALGVNRVTAVYWPAEYKRLYTRTRCAAILLGCYFYSVFLSALMIFGGCRTEFTDFSWRITSSNTVPLVFNQTNVYPVCSPVVHRTYMVIWNGLAVLTLVCAICAVLGVLVFRRRMQERFPGRSIRRLAYQQWSLTAQFTVVVGLLITFVCIYWIAPMMAWANLVSKSAASIFTNVTFLCTCSLNPYVYILLGAMVRRQVFGLPKHESQHEHLTGNYGKRQTQGGATTSC